MIKLKILALSIGILLTGCTSTVGYSTGGQNTLLKYDVNKIQKIERASKRSANSVDIIWVNPPTTESKN